MVVVPGGQSPVSLHLSTMTVGPAVVTITVSVKFLREGKELVRTVSYSGRSWTHAWMVLVNVRVWVVVSVWLFYKALIRTIFPLFFTTKLTT
jgi:hypothetical protein